MPIRQKAKRPTLRILGRTYGPRIVGLHNRFRARTDTFLRYLNLDRTAPPSSATAKGIFVPGRDRHRIYLRPGADDLTLAHELMHAILYTEGFVGLRVSRADLDRHPAMGLLAARLGDLLVHPVLLERMRRARFALERSELLRGAQILLQFGAPEAEPAGHRVETVLLRRFTRAAFLAEALLRHPTLRDPLEVLSSDSDPDVLALARALAEASPWNPLRRGLEYRVRVGRLLALLDEEGRRHGCELALRERILLPPFLTPGKLEQPASRFFAARVRAPFPLQPSSSALIVQFRLDQTSSAFRLYAATATAERVCTHLRREIGSMTACEFLERNRIDAVLVERRGHARIRMVDPQSAPLPPV